MRTPSRRRQDVRHGKCWEFLSGPSIPPGTLINPMSYTTVFRLLSPFLAEWRAADCSASPPLTATHVQHMRVIPDPPKRFAQSHYLICCSMETELHVIILLNSE